MNNVLILVRHGESEWNKLNLFTGWRDPDLTPLGVAEAERAGRLMRAQGFHVDVAFTSCLKRAQRTLSIILTELGQHDLQPVVDLALNERDYGELSGLNKHEASARWGDEQVHVWRRSYDIAPPGGESLEDTRERVVPFYRTHILPQVLGGKTVLVAAHGNSLRALIMHIEGMTPDEIVELTLATAVPVLYRFTADGTIADKSSIAG